MRELSRLVLPLLLLAGAVTTWIVSQELGTSTREQARGGEVTTVDLPFTSVRRVPEFATSSQIGAQRDAAIESLPAESTSLSCLTILVDGAPLHRVRGDASLVPAYAQLLVTGHAAIETLGPGYRFETRAMADALPDSNGRIFNGLFLVGGGDPVLMSHNYSLSFRPILTSITSIEELADGVAAAGVVRIDGGIVGVERRYDTIRTLPGWPTAYAEAGLAGPLSALQVDDGLVERAAANAGVAIPSEDPAALAAERFDQLLESRQVPVGGTNRSDDGLEELPELVPIASVSSPQLSEIVFQMLATNDAGAAEMLMKELGFADRQSGTTQDGGEVVLEMLQNAGVEIDVAPRDGSGLDPVSTFSCDQLAATVASIDLEHPTIDAMPSYDLPGVFGGQLAALDIDADLRLVGGAVGDASGFVARTVGSPNEVVIASIVNRIGGADDRDLTYQRELLGVVDQLTSSILVEAVEPE